MNTNGVANARSIPHMPPWYSRLIEPIDPSSFPPGVPASIAGVIEHTQYEAQREVAELVAETRWIGDTHSGHSIVLDNPAFVSRLANQVVPTLRRGRTTVNGSLETGSHNRTTRST